LQRLGASLILLRLGPNLGITIVVDFDVDDVGSAAHRAVLNVFLTGTLRHVEWHHDFLPAGIADVAGFVI
jgi:hypothetical protein